MLAALLVLGCSNKELDYYNVVKEQNAQYMEAYKTVENESVTFNGKFEGDITIVKPKELPKLANVRQPKTMGDTALDWARTIVPVAGMVAGMHYNYKTADSANKYNAENISSWTGNFDNTSVTDVSSSVSTSTASDTSSTTVSDTSNISTSTPDVAITGTDVTVTK